MRELGGLIISHIQKPNIDWVLFAAILPLLGAGLITMNSFVGESNYFFEKQLIWIGVSFVVFFGLSAIDLRFLRRTGVIMSLYSIIFLILVGLLILGTATQGAQSWLHFSGFSLQPSDPAKIVVILLLAKYFSRRHEEIANVRHIIVSGIYTFLIFGLVFLQPDFGSAIIIFFIWLGMIMVSGISKRHLAAVFIMGIVAFGGLWGFVFEDYQKQRIMTFLNPLTDIQGAGYNAYQSTVAVGSGQILGKGIGYGTQSRLNFLPEYETDFVFAAFAEEWGYVGVLIIFALFMVVMWRILANALHGASNFETLFALGLGVLFMAHFTVHIGMNIGLLPVTGTTVPFLSYGGSHLLTEFIGLGILMSMRRHKRVVHQHRLSQETFLQ